MAAWDQTSALTTLRSLLGDGDADKYEFKADVVPTPNGVIRDFFAGRTRLSAYPTIYVSDVVEAVPTGDVDLATGTFTLAEAPTGTVQASFYYRWFTDAELLSFLHEACTLLQYTGFDDAALPVGVRSVACEFAVYYAYRRKAGEYAEALTASAGGYTADQSKTGPNWRALAESAWKNAKEKLDLYVKNPLTGAASPQMRFVAYGLPSYVPLS